MWWSRATQPSLHTWAERAQPLRLVEQAVATTDPDPKALACYGVLWRHPQQPPAQVGSQAEPVWLRLVDGRPVTAVTTQFLAWCCERLEQQHIPVWVLVWDNASWHVSKALRAWLRQHNQQVKRSGQGVRILVCCLPFKSPWLNPIEPKWIHGKRAIVEPTRLLSTQELADRVCAYYGCPHAEHLTIPDKVA